MMGYGDKLMAIGEAWAMHEADPSRRRVAIGNQGKLDPDQPELLYGLDNFLADQPSIDAGEDVLWQINGRSLRPYINYEAMWAEAKRAKLNVEKQNGLARKLNKYIWQPYRTVPAPIVLKPEEQELYEHWKAKPRFVVIEPFIKPGAPGSKQWPTERFQAVASLLSREIPVYQLSAPGRPSLQGVAQIDTNGFRQAMAVLKAAALYIGPEGGLHHASAAMGTKAVVIFGSFISPGSTGYDFHTNLTGGADRFCGQRFGMCAHCQKTLDNITVEEVIFEAKKALGLNR